MKASRSEPSGLAAAKQPSIWQVVLVLALGVFAVSTAAILVRLALASIPERSAAFSLVLAAARLLLAALLLLPAWRGFRPETLRPGALLYAIAAGLFLALHFAVWIASLSYTSIATATTLVTTNPIWVALLSWLWFREKLTRLTIAGIGTALLGGILIGLAEGSHRAPEVNSLLGPGLALAGAWAVSLYLLLGREAQRHGLSLRQYVVMAYSVAAIALFPVPLIAGASYMGYPVTVYVCIGLMALLPQLVGHTSFNWAVRWVAPTTVSLATLVEPLLAGVLGYWVFGEVPSPLVFLGAPLLLSGVAIAALGSKQ